MRRVDALEPGLRERLDYDAHSRTAFFGAVPDVAGTSPAAVVTAGTSDVGVAREAVRTLRHSGHAAREIHDAGVVGLWRLLERADELSGFAVIIVAAAMDAALPSVVGVPAPGAIIAVPTAAHYGVATGGETALRSVLASCAPGITAVNIDDGHGAACVAISLHGSHKGTPSP